MSEPTPAHEQRTTIHLLYHFPPHDARTADPHYAAFDALKRRLHKSPLWKCAIRGCTRTDLEVHHSKVEFALQNGIDLASLNEEYGLHLTDDEAFKAWIEGPDNAEILCSVHHRTTEGVHILPEPAWKALRIWRADMEPPAEVERAA